MSTETNSNTLAAIIGHLAQAEIGEPVSIVVDGARYVCAIELDDIMGASYINSFDTYGKVEWRRPGFDRDGSRGTRPPHFTGAARLLTTDEGDRYWWEPYREGHKVYDSDATRAQVMALLNGEGPWGVTVTMFDVETCQCCGHTEVSERDMASLWGIDSLENGYKAEVISELLAELGVTE